MAKTISILPATSSSQHVNCDPCSRETKTKDCDGYCTDCQENLCEECINYHRKLKLTIGHKVVKSGKLVPLTQNDIKMIQKCNLHSGYDVCSFCEDHDKVCCSICESVDHKDCNSVFKISDYASKSKLEEVIKNLKTCLEETKDAYNAVVNSKDNSIKNLEKQKDEALKAVTEKCSKILNLIDKLRNKIVKKVMACFTKATELLEITIKDCQERSLSMDKHLKNLEIKSKCTNDVVAFTEVKFIEEAFKRSERSSEANRKTQLPEIEFTDNNDIMDMLLNTDSLAEVNVFGEHKPLGSVKLKKDGEKAKFSGSVSDMAIQNDGKIITCDYHHSQIVMFDSKLNYLKHLQLPFPPTGICVNNHSNNVIVSHRSKLTTVSLNPCTEVKNTLDTKIKINYNGIASYGDEIYVLHNKDPTVAVYNSNGKQVRHSSSAIQSPAGIAVSADGTWIAVSNFNENAVIILDKSLKVSRKIESLPRLKGPFSLETDAMNRLYVSIKNNVFIIMPDSQTTLLDDNNSLTGWPIVKHSRISGNLLLVTNPWKSIAIWQP